MSHDWNAHLDDCLNHILHCGASLQLHRVGSSFLYKSTRIENGLLLGSMKGHKGHIADDQSIFCATGHCLCMMDHFVHRDGKGILITQNGHGQRVSHENDIDSSSVFEQGHGIVIGGEH